MTTATEYFSSHYKDRSLSARKWLSRGRSVCGYVCNAVPEEMIIAAGMLPVRLSGVPGAPIDTMVNYVGSTAYAEGFMSTMLNSLVTGEIDWINYLVLPQTRNTEETQFGHLEMIRELWPETNLPPIYKIDEAQSWSYGGVEHYYKMLSRFRAQLESWTGYCVSDRRLRDAIEICNESRALIHKAHQLRKIGKVSGSELLQIIGSSFVCEKDEHNQYLRVFLREAENREATHGVPVYVDASPLDNLQLYSLIESCGGSIVDEDNCWGMRSVEDLVDTERFSDSIEALAQRYHYRKPCPYICFPIDARCDYCKEKLGVSNAKGVIYYAYENDAAQHWDYAIKKPTITESGLPMLTLLGEPYLMSNKAELSAKITEFLAKL